MSRTGYNISNAPKLQFCKKPFEIIQGQIGFKNTVQCVNKQAVVLLLHPVFKRAGRVYFLFLERGISFRANSTTVKSLQVTGDTMLFCPKNGRLLEVKQILLVTTAMSCESLADSATCIKSLVRGE